jgi:hypothetical protein
VIANNSKRKVEQHLAALDILSNQQALNMRISATVGKIRQISMHLTHLIKVKSLITIKQ